MNFIEALDTIEKTLNELFKIDLRNPDVLKPKLVELLEEYKKRRDEYEDPYYLKKAVLWIIDMCTAEARKGLKISEYPRNVGKLFDTAHDLVADNKVEGVYSVDSEDRNLLKYGLVDPKFNVNDDKKDRPPLLIVD